VCRQACCPPAALPVDVILSRLAVAVLSGVVLYQASRAGRDWFDPRALGLACRQMSLDAVRLRAAGDSGLFGSRLGLAGSRRPPMSKILRGVVT